MRHRYIVERPFGFQVIVHYNKKGNYHGIYPTLEEAIKVRDKIILEKGLKPKEVNNYFDNKEAFKEMVISKATGRLSPRLLRMSMLVVKAVNKKFKYKNEDDRQDVIAYSYEIIIKNWHNFNEETHDNVLAYITEIVKRAHAMQFKILQKTRINTISIDNFYEEGKDLNI